MMARSTNAPCKGRIQKRKTTLHLLKSGLQRTAGPYKRARNGSATASSGATIGLAKNYSPNLLWDYGTFEHSADGLKPKRGDSEGRDQHHDANGNEGEQKLGHLWQPF
jgi:hypothetical protein